MSLIDNLTKEEIVEIPMIDIMYHYLRDERQPVDFYTLMDKIAQYKGWSEKEKQNRLVQAYTDMNIDGRFVALGDNKWGLKNWYPVEQTEEELATTIKPKKRKKKVVEDDFDDYDEIDELELEEEELDEFDEDEEDLDIDEELEDLDDVEKLDEDEEFIEEDEEFEIEEDEEE